MTMGYTNGNHGYIPTDRALKRGVYGGYEAAKLPSWWSCGALSGEFPGPPEVGVEGIIRNAIASLWAEQ